jgi:hypothetical protein
MTSIFDGESAAADDRLHDVISHDASYQAAAGGDPITVKVAVNLDVVNEPDGEFETVVPGTHTECVVQKSLIQAPARGDVITIPAMDVFTVDSVSAENSDDLNWALMVH